MSSDLPKFLWARLAEAVDDAERGYLKAPELPGYEGWDKTTTVALSPAVATLVLADLASKQQLLDEHAAHVENPGFCRNCGLTVGPCRTKRLLGLPYVNHPDYDEAWRP